MVVNTLGYDPIWFGVIIVLVAGMGVITQPVGVNVFIMKGQWLLFIFRHEIAYVSDSF
ncbi:TRAP transporter large permease subunit [Pseudogracilibacillus sp. SO30301A]|uniref:TRAP transporter large permease subunit n=1 Tax=Pseudogracilibacillus sp. SO30301A TaxID=3098291 RepID=UPI00300DC154